MNPLLELGIRYKGGPDHPYQAGERISDFFYQLATQFDTPRVKAFTCLGSQQGRQLRLDFGMPTRETASDLSARPAQFIPPLKALVSVPRVSESLCGAAHWVSLRDRVRYSLSARLAPSCNIHLSRAYSKD